jgi:CcmD family protein
LFAQEMATEMRSNGKIYVVVAVLVTIFVGILLYLIRLDRKLTKLERETKLNH